MTYGYLRRLVTGLVVGGALLVAALGMSGAVGAQAPTASGYPPNTVISTYFDPRYCNGLVSVVTDGSGNLINVCTTTGQRVYPVYPDFAPYYGYAYKGYGPFVYAGGVYPYYGGFYGYYGYGGCGTSIYAPACVATGITPAPASANTNPVYNRPVIAPPPGVRV